MINSILNFRPSFTKRKHNSSKKPMNDNSNSTFCFKLANHVLQTESKNGTNIAISPLSFQVVLALIAAGSTGRTLVQFLFHLGYENVGKLNSNMSELVSLVSDRKNSTGGPLLAFANGAWIEQSVGLNVNFQSIGEKVFRAQVKEVDFVNKVDQVTSEVNSWAKRNTNGLIKEILPSGSLDKDTVLVLANALYFKGAWHKQFDKNRTEIKDFHCLNGRKLQVPFMTSSYGEKHFYKCYNDYKVLQIPYRSGTDTQIFSMYFFLPDKIDGLQRLLYKLSSNHNMFSQDFELKEEELSEFWIPRFKFSFEFEASNVVNKLGLDLMFRGTGELNGMVKSLGRNKLCVSKIFHKTYIEVNEEGTEAAASTAAVIMLKCATFPTASFVANHPFAFMVREETSKVVLFTGTVLNPLE